MATSNTSDDQYVLIGDKSTDVNLANNTFNSALKNWFMLRDVRSYDDIAKPFAKFMDGKTAADSSRAWLEMIAGAHGKETT